MLQLPRGINNLPEGSTLLMLWQGLLCICDRLRACEQRVRMEVEL